MRVFTPSSHTTLYSQFSYIAILTIFSCSLRSDIVAKNKALELIHLWLNIRAGEVFK